MISKLREFWGYFRGINLGLVLVFAVIGLTLLGLVVLASASLSFSQDTGSIFNKQLVWLCIGVIMGTLTFCVDLEKLRGLWMVIGVGTFLLLVLVLVPGVGVRVNGAQRWLGTQSVRFQVSEFAKLSLVFILAHYLSAKQRHIKEFVLGFVVPSVIIGVVSGLIILEPDFGTAFLCGCVGLGMLFIAGVRLRYLLPSLLGGGLVFFIAVLLNPVRLRRLTSFLDMEGNKSDGAYQLWQGILGFAAGGGYLEWGLGMDVSRWPFYLRHIRTLFFRLLGRSLGCILR